MDGATTGAAEPTAGATLGARRPRPDFAASTSRAMTRPWGPEPSMRPTSTPASLASRRASGEEKILLVPPAPAPCPFVAGCSAAAGFGGAGGGGGTFAWTGVWGAAAAGAACVVGAGAAGAFAGGAPFPAATAAAFTSSPSCASTAIIWSTGTSFVPSGTTIFASPPSSTASYSLVVLSVSISGISSPVFTASPSFFSHLARLPFSMVGESAGMKMLIGMRPTHQTRSAVTAGLRRFDHFGHRRQRELFQIRRVRHRNFLAGYACDRRIEVVERLLHHTRGNLGADAGLFPALLDSDDAPRLLHRLDDGARVHGFERAQVDHFGGNVFLCKFIGSLQRVGHAHGPRDNGYVVARAHHTRAAERQDIVRELRHR